MGVNGFRDRLGAAGNGLEHEQFADAVARVEELGQHVFERRSVVFGQRVGGGVPRALWRGDAGESQFAQVAGQRGLGDRKASILEQLAKLLLARDGLCRHELENDLLPPFLVHASRLSVVHGRSDDSMVVPEG